jgi:hypothetical protein
MTIWLDGEGTLLLRRALAAHLGECGDCREVARISERHVAARAAIPLGPLLGTPWVGAELGAPTMEAGWRALAGKLIQVSFAKATSVTLSASAIIALAGTALASGAMPELSNSFTAVVRPPQSAVQLSETRSEHVAAPEATGMPRITVPDLAPFAQGSNATGSAAPYAADVEASPFGRLTIEDIATLLSATRTLLERLASTGEIPIAVRDALATIDALPDVGQLAGDVTTLGQQAPIAISVVPNVIESAVPESERTAIALPESAADATPSDVAPENHMDGDASAVTSPEVLLAGVIPEVPQESPAPEIVADPGEIVPETIPEVVLPELSEGLLP